MQDTYVAPSSFVFVFEHRQTGRIECLYTDAANRRRLETDPAWRYLRAIEPLRFIRDHWHLVREQQAQQDVIELEQEIRLVRARNDRLERLLREMGAEV
jgi:hypothetical protein